MSYLESIIVIKINIIKKIIIIIYNVKIRRKENIGKVTITRRYSIYVLFLKKVKLELFFKVEIEKEN